MRWMIGLLCGALMAVAGSSAQSQVGPPATPESGVAARGVVTGSEELQINSYTTADEERAVVAIGPDGDFVVVWGDFNTAFDDYGRIRIVARRFTSAGTAIGGEFQVNSYTGDAQAYMGEPSVAMDAEGDFVVAWQSYISPGTDQHGFSIQARRFTSNGTPMGDQFQVNSYTEYTQWDPSVAVDSDGDFVVVWDSGGWVASDIEDGDGVRGQLFTSAGTPVGGELQVNTYTTYSQDAPSVAMDAEGDFVVVWESDGGWGSDNQVFSANKGIQARRYTSAGMALGVEFQVNSYTTDLQLSPSVAAESDGDFVVVWHGHTAGPTDYGIAGQRFTSAGSPIGGEFEVNSATTNIHTQAAVAVGDDGSFMVTWESNPPQDGLDLVDKDIQARLFDSDGTAAGEDFQVNTYTPNWQYRPSLATDGRGGFVVVWESNARTSDDDIRARLLKSPLIFTDGFESGDTSGWSTATR